MAGEQAWVWWALASLVGIVIFLGLVVWRKGRPFQAGDVFRASRLSRGNRLFPTQILISATSVVEYTPRWIGREEKSIHLAHVASVKVDTRLLFADVLIETTGGHHPIVCYGHRKLDAVRMKALIERHQTAYYRSRPTDPAPSAHPVA